MGEWICVKDRLPEIGQWVLVFDAADERGYMSVWTREEDEDGDCWSDGQGWWQPLAEVTHWMPLPEPPAEVATDTSVGSKRSWLEKRFNEVN